MRIKTSNDKEGTTIHLCEIFSNTVLETSGGNQVAICMRDNTIEFNILKFNPCWYRINMSTGTVEPMDTKGIKIITKEIIKTLLSKGWVIELDDTGRIFNFLPGVSDSRRLWAAEWNDFLYEGKVLNVPGYAIDAPELET